MPADARVVRALLARAQIDAALFDRYQKRGELSGRAGSRMRPIVQLVGRQCAEDADKPGVFLLPSPDEKLTNVISHKRYYDLTRCECFAVYKLRFAIIPL